MTGLKGNPHEENFKRTHDWLADHHDHPETTSNELHTLTADLIGFSTLALAYEQRTANLIAYYTMWNRIEGAVPTKAMDAELEQRLGINDE